MDNFDSEKFIIINDQNTDLKIIDSNTKLIIFDLKKNTDNNLMITLGGLFPRSFTDNLKKYMKQDELDELGKEFNSDTGIEMQKVLVRKLLAPKYRRRFDGIDITNKPKSQFNKYFNNAQGKKDYQAVIMHIFNCAKSGNYTSSDFPFYHDLKKELEDLFNLFPEETNYKEKYTQATKVLINQTFGNKNPLFGNKNPLNDPEYKEALLNAKFLDQITSLVCIAITWPIWDQNSKQATDLANLIFPSMSSKDNTSTKSNEEIMAYVTLQKNKTANIYDEALKLYDNGKYEEASVLFYKITNCKLADDDIIADAYYHCAICTLDHNIPIESNVNAEPQNCKKYITSKELLLEAIHFGSTRAIQCYKKEYKQDFETIPLIRDFSQAQGKAKIILNAVNKYTVAFKNSLPEEMKNIKTRKKLIRFAATQSQWMHEIDSISNLDKDCRFLLFDDNSEKNFQDLIYILDRISYLQKEASLANSKKVLLKWYKIAIYIRVKEDEYSALIDTALKRLGDYTVRVYIIDDNKWAAQYLLYQYPLFQPIQYITGRNLRNTAITLSFTVISNHNTELACWLVKEAFWLGCFHYKKITLSINIIGPNANEIEQQLRFQCPGIYGKIPDSDSISKVVINKPYEVDSINSSDTINAIRDCKNPISAYNYYVIDIGDSAENLNFAIKLRELSIRDLISSNQKLQNSSLPIITFYCPDTNIAHLSDHIVIQNVDSGNQWFNNYNVKPFGIINDRYSFENLDGGYLEKVAQSTHLQYSHANATDSCTQKLEKLKDYFLRSYNHDSSMAVALSMPYRLFQTETNDTSHIISSDSEIVPYLIPNDIKEIANLFSSCRLNNQQNLLNFEHSRWLRWALSRGWEPASPDQVLNYMKDGNLKHQLYIAKLHGCICGLNELENFSNALYNEAEYSRMDTNQKKRYENIGENGATTPFDFKSTDISNIDATADIITIALYPENVVEEDILVK